MSKTVGRPKALKSKAKVPGISVRLSASERKLIDKAISKSGLSQSEWTRNALIYVAKSNSLGI